MSFFLSIYSGTPRETCLCISFNENTTSYKIYVFCIFFTHQNFLLRALMIPMPSGKEKGCSLFLSGHSGIYLQICIWNDHIILLIALQVITRTIFTLPLQANHLTKCSSHPQIFSLRHFVQHYLFFFFTLLA